MMKLFSVTEMQFLEKEANQEGLTYETMMENAGRGIAKEIESAYSHLNNNKVFALVGSGNNGGDALVALSHLSTNNWETCAYIVHRRAGDNPLIDRLIDNSGRVIDAEEDNKFMLLSQLIESSCVLIDGVLGTGIKLPIKGEIGRILAFVKTRIKSTNNTIHVVAVDCPSGVDCDTGEIADETIPAEITITMAGMKPGLIKFPAAGLTGEIRFASIGSIENLQAYKENQKIVLNTEVIKNNFPKRPLDSHKGTFGTAFIIAGSVNYTGAALLAGLAAYRIGSGLVTMAVPAPLHEALSGNLPEATWVLLPHELGVISQDAAQTVRKNINRATAILIGPGLGLEDTTKEFIRRFIATTSERRGNFGFLHDTKLGDEGTSIQIPMVVDADGLKLISKIGKWSELLPSPAVLTPHPGEMAVLTGLSMSEIQENRIDIAKEYSIKWGHVVVLKGAYTVIANPTGQIAVVPVATPALAKAGTGDVLAGLIVGLLAQRVDAFLAACIGAWIHAYAGLLAARILGNTASVIARDVLNSVPQIISDLQLVEN
jgi:ADP-dependent NAD(P)H-hydrate dehydratase / NAD(P)H-hydrate epimerase